jgi:hypothetical protein
MMLTSVLSSSKDIGRHGRTRARQILGQTRSLEELFRAYEDGLVATPATQEPVFAGIRLDRVAADIVRPIRLSASTQISYDAIEVSANVDRLGFYRAFRNIIGNAVEAAGPHGTVTVRISAVDGLAVVDVDVDGPDFDAVRPMSALSLGIAREFVRPLGGRVQIRRGSPARGVRMLFPLIANGYTPMRAVPNA